MSYILAVDDSLDNLILVQLALESAGYDLKLVDNGPDALACVEQEPPELIVLDVMMPGMDGLEVTRRLRQNRRLPYIPILLITAHDQPSVVKGLDSGADEFIRKPVKVEELQARARSLLRLKQSIDQRENFVQCLTHDLRTPLVAANRMLSLVKDGAFGDVTPEIEQAMDTTIVNNDNLLSLLDNLLEAYSYDVGQKVFSFIEFDLAALLAEVVTELMPLAQAQGLMLTWTATTPVVEIVGDRLELRRVLANLIGNALKFTEQGCVQIQLDKTASGVKIRVRDTGIGMTAAMQAQIFERFQQGDSRRSGHGLGLYLCRQIVEAHNGMITVQSQLSRGSIFEVTLPKSPDQCHCCGE
ncbi:MAG: hybrid sensor histidine kinase/response regulator [Spirulinaceae cyanobacterium RM2_2_10]|nr:hybrid sensor histidine kinase/response regulator [Spirulinaceae cyanobacterium SM2_1_0]NJO20462.1 hybrid sensor histidine kinase/response regulator [Spirulinaceae cyanobacterium RM2_2_10]